ncbi:class I SAM-dependent methyltransferase [Streptomyces goshikiensis]|uniref:class I SAM-dependent methyltransferase n=1 Tax=Streptomyces goshikiensis TaxID=1942 RepID=UPI0033B933E4
MTPHGPQSGRAQSYAALRPARGPSSLVLDALELLGRRHGRALDIGAGPLSDARHLLRAGFDVDAVDPDAETLRCAMRLGNSRLTVIPRDIREAGIPAGRYDLVLAVHVLPFLPRRDLPGVVAAIQAGLTEGGLFCCTFFGVNDSWARWGRPMTFLTPPEVHGLCTGLQSVVVTEREYEGHDAHGRPKHWHIVRAIMRRGEVARTTGGEHLVSTPMRGGGDLGEVPSRPAAAGNDPLEGASPVAHTAVPRSGECRAPELHPGPSQAIHVRP